MCWKIGHDGNDPRHPDLAAVLALLILIAAASRLLSSGYEAPSATAFIVPSQSCAGKPQSS
jgi:hypothetical protein